MIYLVMEWERTEEYPVAAFTENPAAEDYAKFMMENPRNRHCTYKVKPVPLNPKVKV